MFHNPQIDTIYKKGSNGIGVLALHGFTGTPDSLRPLIVGLAEKNYTVLAPLLAGHGLTPQQCATTGWQEWYKTASEAFDQLKNECSKVFVTGLSLGSLLALKLAIEKKEEVSALAYLAIPLFFSPWIYQVLNVVHYSPIRHVWKYQKKVKVDIKDPRAAKNFWNYDLMPISCIKSIGDFQHIVRENLGEINQPALMIHSRHDSTAPYDSMSTVARSIKSSITESITLENSFHVITIDYEKDLVTQKVCEFFDRFK